jgi:hypothetical protein
MASETSLKRDTEGRQCTRGCMRVLVRMGGGGSCLLNVSQVSAPTTAMDHDFLTHVSQLTVPGTSHHLFQAARREAQVQQVQGGRPPTLQCAPPSHGLHMRGVFESVVLACSSGAFIHRSTLAVQGSGPQLRRGPCACQGAYTAQQGTVPSRARVSHHRDTPLPSLNRLTKVSRNGMGL